MDGEVYHEQVLCLDALTSDDDPEDRSSDVDSEDGVFQDPIPTVVSVRPEVTEKWMDRFVVDLVECPSVSKSVSEEYSPVVFAGGGGGGCRCIPPGGRRVRLSSGVCPAISSVRLSSVCPARCRL